MELSRHESNDGAHGSRWALGGKLLPADFTLSHLLAVSRDRLAGLLQALPVGDTATGRRLPPIDRHQEVWAAGVTYLRSRDAREAETQVRDVYSKVYDAERPELFMKSVGWRVVGHESVLYLRRDSKWNVPEPELVLVVNALGEVVGYCAGNDMSSRDIEGENPLYLPQAKVFKTSCVLGPTLHLASANELRDIEIQLTISRNGVPAFTGETRTSRMKRRLEELVGYLGRELEFPEGVFLMTGTGIVPEESFTLQSGDVIDIRVGACRIVNPIG
jgi:2-dehydro-3-deoxy-D-arabinonate dehydratase